MKAIKQSMNTPRSHGETGTEGLLSGLRGWTRRAIQGVLGAGALALAGCGAVQAGGYWWNEKTGTYARGTCTVGEKEISFGKTDGWWYPGEDGYEGGNTPDEAANKICPEKKVASAGSGGVTQPKRPQKTVEECQQEKHPSDQTACLAANSHWQEMTQHVQAETNSYNVLIAARSLAREFCLENPAAVTALLQAVAATPHGKLVAGNKGMGRTIERDCSPDSPVTASYAVLVSTN